MKKSKVIEKIVIGVCTLATVWLVASYINVMNHNMTDHVYAYWNFFNLFTR